MVIHANRIQPLHVSMQCLKAKRLQHEQILFSYSTYQCIDTFLILLDYLWLEPMTFVSASTFIIQFLQVFLTIFYYHTWCKYYCVQI